MIYPSASKSFNDYKNAVCSLQMHTTVDIVHIADVGIVCLCRPNTLSTHIL